LPGHGVVTAQAWAGRYLRGVGGDRLKGLAPPFVGQGYFNTAVEISPEKGVESVTCDLALDPGRTLSGTVAGPDGKPLDGAIVAGLSVAGDWEHQPLSTAAFIVTALKPGEVRLLQFSHAEKKLAGSLVVRGDTKGPLTVKLGPAGALTGRFVLPDGKPLADVELVAQLYEPIADPRVPNKPPDPTIGNLPRDLRTHHDRK